jgi:histidinol dehydrogenase
MTLAVFEPGSAALTVRLGNASERFAALVAAADQRSRPFYQKIFGEPLGCEAAVQRIVDAVAEEGDVAVAKYSQAFDGNALAPGQLRVPAEAFVAAWNAVSPELREALTAMVSEVTAYQEKLLPQDWFSNGLGTKFTALERVGAYVPGGTGGALPLCSSVVMNLVPAKVAGVRDLVLVTPPRSDGSLAPEILAACYAAGVTEAYAVGGVQAIAALACGTATIPAVDCIVGPGNIFVTLAKKAVFGRVAIDMLAGPSEVLVIADDSCHPAWVAADLLSQAEHDQLAMSVLLTIGEGVLPAIQDEVAKQLAALPDKRRVVAEVSLAEQGFAVPCADLAQALEISNRYAPEHLELLVRDEDAALAGIQHAGAVFVGPWSPEPIGDYMAGPSHTLPTGGTARLWSGIGAELFIKRTSIIRLDEAHFRRLSAHSVTLARGEGLEAHARSITVRG